MFSTQAVALTSKYASFIAPRSAARDDKGPRRLEPADQRVGPAVEQLRETGLHKSHCRPPPLRDDGPDAE